MEGGDGLFASEGDAAEAFDPVEESFHKVAFLVERPVDQFGPAARRVLLDLRHCPEFAGNEIAQVIRIIARIRDDMSDTFQPLDQPARLRAVAPVSGGDENPDRQPQRIDRSMDLGGQAAPGSPDGVSFKPPFLEVASACTLQMVASMRTYSKSGSRHNALKRLSHTPARDQRRNRV